MKAALKYLTGIAGPSGFGSKSTADQVTINCSCPPFLTAIVTGATSGIGVETARVLAKKGIRVVIPARNLERAAEVKENILREIPEAQIIILEIDLSSMASVSRFCSQFLSLDLPLNILINNAGVFSKKLEFSEDKIEITVATNYLGHYLLTELLLEKMVETAAQTGIEGRIINVSSLSHTWVNNNDHFSLSKLMTPNNYNGTRAYAQSKLANILHAKEIARQLKEKNARVTINAVHPGVIKTEITRNHKGFIRDSIYFLAAKFLKSPSQGAATTCYVALSPKIEGISGKYFADCNETCCSSLASDASHARRLWKNTRAVVRKRLHHPAL